MKIKASQASITVQALEQSLYCRLLPTVRKHQAQSIKHLRSVDLAWFCSDLCNSMHNSVSTLEIYAFKGCFVYLYHDFNNIDSCFFCRHWYYKQNIILAEYKGVQRARILSDLSLWSETHFVLEKMSISAACFDAKFPGLWTKLCKQCS